MTPALVPRRAALLAGVVAVALAGALGTTDLLPPGPHTDYAELGAGTDLDIQLEYAWAASDYPAWAIPHWDPHPDFGQPLFANPEAFVGHPAFVLGRAAGGPQTGLRWLYRMQIVILLLGGVALGARLGVPWWLGLAAALPLLSTAEWHQRIGVGHLMIVGLTCWPLAAAGAVGGFDAAGRSDHRRATLWGALAGLAVATAFLGGGHYATAFGVLLILLTGWLWLAGRPGALALAGVAALPFLIPRGEWSPVPLEIAACAVVGWGLWRGRDRLRGAGLVGVGLGLGLVAGSGARLLPAWRIVRMNWRASPWRELESEPLDLAPLLDVGRELALEQLLPVAEPWHWAILVGGLAALLFVRSDRGLSVPGALGVAGLLFVLLAWGAGRPMHPWRVLTLLPGLAAINYPGRLQWILLILPWFGWAALLARGAAGRGRSGVAACAALAVALAIGASDRLWLEPYPEAAATGAPRATEVSQVVIGGSDLLLSGTSALGWIRPGLATGIGFLPLEGPVHRSEALAQAEAPRRPEQGTPDAIDGAVEAVGGANRWTVRAPPGTQVRVVQRDVRGWSCRGGEQISYPEDDPRDVRVPHRGNNWLRVVVGESGVAICTWRTPGLVLGALLQLLAIAALAVLGRRIVALDRGGPPAR